MKVNTGSQGPILFINQEKTSTHRRRGLDDSNCKGVLDVFLHRLLLRSREVVEPTAGERSPRLEVDGTVIWTMRWHRRASCLQKTGARL